MNQIDVSQEIVSVLIEIATSKSAKISQRLAAVEKLRLIERQQAKDALRQREQTVREANAASRRREAEVRIIEQKVAAIQSKTELLTEQRRRRATDAKYARYLRKLEKDAANEQN